MPTTTLKNVGGHLDHLHDGRPFPVGETRDVNDADLDSEHYTSRLADGAFLIVPDDDKAPRTTRAKTTTSTSEEAKS